MIGLKNNLHNELEFIQILIFRSWYDLVLEIMLMFYKHTFEN